MSQVEVTLGTLRRFALGGTAIGWSLLALTLSISTASAQTLPEGESPAPGSTEETAPAPVEAAPTPESEVTPVTSETPDTSVDSVVDGEGTTSAFGNIDPAKVTTEDKKTRVEGMLVDQRETLGRVVAILAEARATKDIVQLNCVNEKLTQVKGLLKISEQASLQMYEAIADNAADLVNHEFTKVVVAHQKSQVLRAEAEQCVGEASVYGGNTEVDVDIDNEGSYGGGDPTTQAAPPPGPTVPPVSSTF